MKRYKPLFETFKGNEKIIVNNIESKYNEYKSFYKNNEKGLIEVIDDELKLGQDKVIYYIKELRKIKRIK